MESIKLRVQQERKSDMGRNIARIDSKNMRKLNLETGDVVALKGKKESACLAWPGYPQDENKGIIRLNSRVRKNTGTNIKDLIEIRKFDKRTAYKVSLAPMSVKIRPNLRFESFIKRKLNDYPVTLDDILIIEIGISREIQFKVIDLEPRGICIINQDTDLYISEKLAQETQFSDGKSKSPTEYTDDFKGNKRLIVVDKDYEIIGKFEVGINNQTLKRLNLKDRALISINHKKSKNEKILVLVKALEGEERIKNAIHIHENLRREIGALINDEIIIDKAKITAAQEIILAPEGRNIKSNPRFELSVKQKLLNYPVKLNEFVNLTSGISIPIKFKVVSIYPLERSFIDLNTNLKISPKTLSDLQKKVGFDVLFPNFREQIIYNNKISLKKLKELFKPASSDDRIFFLRVLNWVFDLKFKFDGVYLYYDEMGMLNLINVIEKEIAHWHKYNKFEDFTFTLDELEFIRGMEVFADIFSRIKIDVFKCLLQMDEYESLFNRMILKWMKDFNFRIQFNSDDIYIVFEKEGMSNFLKMILMYYKENNNIQIQKLAGDEELLSAEYLKADELSEIFQMIVSLNSRISLEKLRNLLNMQKYEFDIKIFKWAQKYGYKIKGNYLIIEEDGILEFLDNLDSQFKEWELGIKDKDKKED